ncbi:hypothetical protein CEP51_003842 [Fusarium floridanum]|uniref:Uncharacterized protein n=1 Tax=Fusarium floridanum TaxID=1325733 RepID=A0A428S462_9HYPO|nr:hypothetical protein CEP51_003842 [Fusarium floridanum]
MDPAKQTPPNPSLPLASHILIDSSSGIAHDVSLSSLPSSCICPADEDIRELIVLNHLTQCRSPDATTALKVQLLSSDLTEEYIQAFRVHSWHSLSSTRCNPIFR